MTTIITLCSYNKEYRQSWGKNSKKIMWVQIHYQTVLLNYFLAIVVYGNTMDIWSLFKIPAESGSTRVWIISIGLIYINSIHEIQCYISFTASGC